MLVDAQFVRLLVRNQLDASQRDLSHSRDDGGGVPRRGRSPIAGELQRRGRQRHLWGCRLCIGLSDKSGTADENNTRQLQETPAADYGTLTYGPRHPRKLAATIRIGRRWSWQA
jgi:hypothetical protein